MARNKVQFQRGPSDVEFERLYGTEEKCREALPYSSGALGAMFATASASGSNSQRQLLRQHDIAKANPATRGETQHARARTRLAHLVNIHAVAASNPVRLARCSADDLEVSQRSKLIALYCGQALAQQRPRACLHFTVPGNVRPERCGHRAPTDVPPSPKPVRRCRAGSSKMRRVSNPMRRHISRLSRPVGAGENASHRLQHQRAPRLRRRP